MADPDASPEPILDLAAGASVTRHVSVYSGACNLALTHATLIQEAHISSSADASTFRITTHTADAPVHRPLQLIGSILRDAVAARQISWEIMRRDLRSQYRTSLLGSLIPLLPALTTAAWAILCRDAHLINVGAVDMPYPFFVLCGMMLWAAFLESMDAPISGILAEQGLLSKASIPPETVTLARLGQVTVNFGVKAVLILIAAIFYHVHVSATIVLAPFAVLLMITLGTSIGLILAPINLLYTDISKALPVVTTFWFFTTPVIFTTPQEGWPKLVMNHLNPVTPLLTATRELAFGHGLSMPTGVALTSGFTALLFLVAIVFHRLSMSIVIDRANA